MASRKKTLNFIGNLIGRMAIFHVLFLAAFFACLNPVSIPVLDEFAKGVFDFRGITRKGTMSEKLVTGRCQHCDCHIEFDASGFQEGSLAPVKCPDCQKVTEVFVPQSKTANQPPILPKIKKKLIFKNPANGYTEEVSDDVWVPVLLLGCFYFASKGIWTHAVAGALAAICTCGLSWIIYPLFAKEIICKNYLRMGWIQVSQ